MMQMKMILEKSYCLKDDYGWDELLRLCFLLHFSKYDEEKSQNLIHQVKLLVEEDL